MEIHLRFVLMSIRLDSFERGGMRICIGRAHGSAAAEVGAFVAS